MKARRGGGARGWQDLLASLVGDVAQAMRFLHAASPPIVHGSEWPTLKATAVYLSVCLSEIFVSVQPFSTTMFGVPFPLPTP